MIVLSVALFTLIVNAYSFVAFLAVQGISININLFVAVLMALLAILTVSSLFLVINSFYQRYSKKSKYKKSLNLLKMIMKGEKTNPKEIGEIWFNKEVKMFENIMKNKYFAYGLIILGGMILVTGIILSIIYCEEINLCNLGKYLITISIGVIAIGIAMLSVKLGKESDEKMESLTNYHLLEIKGIIEDIRLTLQKHIKKITLMAKTGRDYTIAYDIYHSDYSYSMWKCYTYLQQIPAILEYSTPKYQLEIINYVHLYFDIVKEGRDKTKIELIPEHKKHIRWSYNIISKFPAFSQYKERKKLLEVMKDITS